MSAGFDELLARARGSQRLWAAAPRAEMDARYARFIEVVLAHTHDVGEVASLVHKPEAEALSAELLPLLECARFVMHKTAEILQDQPLKVAVAPHKRHVTVYRPRGVVLLIAPFNFPLSIAGSEILFAIAAQNAVVLKPSPHRVEAAYKLVEWLTEAGFPPHLVQVETGDAQHTQALIKAGVDYVTFVGSTQAGREVAKLCIDAGVPYRAELGGKAAALVTKDAPMGRAARGILWGAFMGGGQVCAGVQRVFVEDAAQDALLSAIEQAARDIDEARDLAPVVSPAARAEVDAFVDDALSRGGRVLVEKRRDDVRAVLLACDDQDARIFREECFGPVAAVCTVPDVEHAVRACNAGPGDLIGYVFAKAGRTKHLRDQLRASTVMENDVLWTYGMPEAPWGGGAQSAMGVTHSAEGLRQYCQALFTSYEQVPVRLDKEPFWYPYTDDRVRALRAGMRTLYGKSGEKVKSIASFLFRRE